jgi:hypothetical protein
MYYTQVRYGITKGDVGLPVSLYQDKVAFYVFDYANCLEAPGKYDLEVEDAESFCRQHHSTIYWTRRLPLEWKNEQREVWGLKPLTEEKPLPRFYLNWGISLRPNEGHHTAPLSLGEKLKEFGVEKLWRGPMFKNPEVGLCYTFAMPSSRMEELEEKLVEWEYSFDLEVLNWCDHGWGG